MFVVVYFGGYAMVQGVCVEPSVRNVDTGEIAIGGFEAGINNSSAVLLEQLLENDAHTVKSLEFPILRLPESPFSTEFMVRVLDVVGSALILLLAAPVMVLVGLFVKLTSVGPVLYKQRRVGEYGRVFTLYKFRTMVHDAEKHTGPVWAAKNDERVTPAGKILRRTRLDELPQLFNVLKGDMSLVGPRPERPYFVKQHKVLQGVRLVVKPGITGLAQVRGYYDLKPEHKLKYDYLYIQKRSFLLNLYILLQTIPVVLLKKGW
jgi:lipopolysaccharide/colanic/teichoic acid biosynthesis glycosyltransferase